MRRGAKGQPESGRRPGATEAAIQRYKAPSRTGLPRMLFLRIRTAGELVLDERFEKLEVRERRGPDLREAPG